MSLLGGRMVKTLGSSRLTHMNRLHCTGSKLVTD